MNLTPVRQVTILSILFLALTLSATNPKALASETEKSNRCSGISLEGGATLLALSITDLQQSSSDLPVSPDDLKKNIYTRPPYSCSIRSKSNFLKGITYVTYVYNAPGDARLEFSKMKKGFASTSTVEGIADIGDEAFWAGASRFQRLVAVKENVVIDVLSPKDFDLQKQIIGLVLEKFY
ncbi:MAG: hypothetical protein KJ804_10030 [Proteobacteria bacterium]|nr:hypothetical protein [Pseudomonadota bacterium]MBU1058640.1 hypothetical protein [Pseudomonadota bacterium]